MSQEATSDKVRYERGSWHRYERSKKLLVAPSHTTSNNELLGAPHAMFHLHSKGVQYELWSVPVSLWLNLQAAKSTPKAPK